VIGRLRRWLGGSRAELREVERAVRKLADAQRDQASTLDRRIASLAEQVAQRSSAKDATEIFHAVRALGAALERDADASAYKALDAVAAGPGPIVVGPWTGEVGFELLYWIPFVHWFRTRWRVPPDRFVVVSRGGTARWYGMPEARYVDIFSFVPPPAFRARTDQDKHKQRHLLPFDRELLETVGAAHGLAGAANLHPEIMYRTLAPFWRDEAGFGLVERFTRHVPLEPFDHPALGTLPGSYVAARFYFSDCFPDTPGNRALAHDVVTRLAQVTAVVLLNPGVRVDDHVDHAPAAAPNVITLPAGVAPDENLAVQSAAVSRARAFVGTYGGYAYLAPFYGVPAVAFYSARTFKQHHLHVAQRVFERLGGPTVTAIDAADAPLVHAATIPAASSVRQ
jgi:hypothetical protein